MSGALLFGVCGALIAGVGLYGFLASPQPVRRIMAFNVMGSGVFVLFGALARRAPGVPTDPTPQAMIITGVVVALSVTALALALIARVETQGGAGAPDTQAPQKPAED
jgi:multicomponent Na+:H+ antiporter subunit C